MLGVVGLLAFDELLEHVEIDSPLRPALALHDPALAGRALEILSPGVADDIDAVVDDCTGGFDLLVDHACSDPASPISLSFTRLGKGWG
jgi:hypothetical protein